MRRMGAPESHPTTSRFTEVVPHPRILLTNLLDFIPGVAPYESHIGVDFHVAAGSVRMVVTLDELHDAHMTRMQEEGFTSQLTKLDGRFG